MPSKHRKKFIGFTQTPVKFYYFLLGFPCLRLYMFNPLLSFFNRFLIFPVSGSRLPILSWTHSPGLAALELTRRRGSLSSLAMDRRCRATAEFLRHRSSELSLQEATPSREELEDNFDIRQSTDYN